jgi:DNA topoisomerase-1
MIENLVIVESPAKAKTIEKFLGKDFQVTSSMGHIRDLSKKEYGIDIKNGYAPQYIVPDDKKKIVSELKKQVKNSQVVWLASDEDREGEAIAWHLCEVLDLDPKSTRRIVFHEITEQAIKDSLKSYRTIDQDLVNAQQARRILDRLVGFELSPVLWKKVKPQLSAGRVQSVAVRLVVEREREIIKFKSTSNYRIRGIFKIDGTKNKLDAEVSKRFDTDIDASAFLEKCKTSEFKVANVVKKPSKKSPAAPFTTSTLQQEASRKLGYSVTQTMTIAQRLYEAGHITYMRTDSVNLSDLAKNAAVGIITKEYGQEYSQTREFKSKAKGAQEAHEAIRPTYLEKRTVPGNNSEQRLYELIWKRTLASQMSDAQLEKTTVDISVSKADDKFVAQGEVLKFEGFLKVYIESTDDEIEDEEKGLLPPIKVGQLLNRESINATQRFTHHPPRFTEASLVRKLEELGIGRPSTYAPTISTIVNRGYVLKEDRDGVERKFIVINLLKDKVGKETMTEITGAEKSKLFPDNIGMIVNDFLLEYFKEVLDFNFTATVEKQFDEIAAGKGDWAKMIDNFYKPFHKQVETTLEVSDYTKGERELGIDPESGKPVIARMARYGPVVQIGEQSEDPENKPRFASMIKGQHIETITLEEAMVLFQLPRTLGEYEDKVMTVAIGRFGPYVRHDNKFVSLKKNIDDPYAIEAERAIELIEEKREKDRNKFIKSFDDEPDLQVLNGRWGPYIAYQKKNFKIPKDTDPTTLTKEDCLKLIKEAGKAPKKKTTRTKKK